MSESEQWTYSDGNGSTMVPLSPSNHPHSSNLDPWYRSQQLNHASSVFTDPACTETEHLSKRKSMENEPPTSKLSTSAMKKKRSAEIDKDQEVTPNISPQKSPKKPMSLKEKAAVNMRKRENLKKRQKEAKRNIASGSRSGPTLAPEAPLSTSPVLPSSVTGVAPTPVQLHAIASDRTGNDISGTHASDVSATMKITMVQSDENGDQAMEELGDEQEWDGDDIDRLQSANEHQSNDTEFKCRLIGTTEQAHEDTDALASAHTHKWKRSKPRNWRGEARTYSVWAVKHSYDEMLNELALYGRAGQFVHRVPNRRPDGKRDKKTGEVGVGTEMAWLLASLEAHRKERNIILKGQEVPDGYKFEPSRLPVLRHNAPLKVLKASALSKRKCGHDSERDAADALNKYTWYDRNGNAYDRYPIADVDPWSPPRRDKEYTAKTRNNPFSKCFRREWDVTMFPDGRHYVALRARRAPLTIPGHYSRPLIRLPSGFENLTGSELEIAVQRLRDRYAVAEECKRLGVKRPVEPEDEDAGEEGTTDMNESGREGLAYIRGSDSNLTQSKRVIEKELEDAIMSDVDESDVSGEE